MQTKPSFFSRLADTINREGFEWLMQPRKAYNSYLVFYRGESPRTRFFTRFALSLLGLPLLSAGYVATRLFGVVLNPAEWARNPVKSMLMGMTFVMPAMIVATSFGFKPLLYMMSPFIASAGGAVAVGVMLLTVLTATLLYAAKKMSQSIPDTIKLDNNSLVVSKDLSPKHRVSFPTELQRLAPAYRTLLNQHEVQKNILNNPDPDHHDKETYKMATRRHDQGKGLLRAFENIIEAHRDGKAIVEMLAPLQPDDKTLLEDYVSGLSAINDFENGKIVLKK